MSDRPDVLVFAEDPGAANFVLDLPAELGRKGLDCLVLTAGPATDFLQSRGLASEPVRSGSGAIERYRPCILAVGTAQNPRSPSLQMIADAKADSIPSVGLVDMKVDAHLRFRGESCSPLTYAPDWLVVPDESTKATFVALGFDGSQIEVCGNPSFDRVLRARSVLEAESGAALRHRLFPAFDPQTPITVFVAEHGATSAESKNEVPFDYTLRGRGQAHERTSIVLEELIDGLKHTLPDYYLVARMHPKNRAEEFEPYRDEIDYLSRDEDPWEIVWASDLVVGMTSMLMMEAHLLGKPTLSLLPREIETDWAPDTEQRLTPCVHTRVLLRAFLSRFFHDGIYPGQIASSESPRALQRVACFIEQLAGGTRI